MIITEVKKKQSVDTKKLFDLATTLAANQFNGTEMDFMNKLFDLCGDDEEFYDQIHPYLKSSPDDKKSPAVTNQKKIADVIFVQIFQVYLGGKALLKK